MINLLLRARDLKHVAVFSVHEPPHPSAGRVEQAEEMLFIKEGFSWSAAIFPPFWLAARSAWGALVGYFAVAAALIAGLAALNLGENWMCLAIIALNTFVGFEATNLQRWALDKAGWVDHGTVSGRTQEDCERRFFDLWLGSMPASESLVALTITMKRIAFSPSVLRRCPEVPEENLRSDVTTNEASGIRHGQCSPAKIF